MTQQRIALVTNASDFAGPPAVRALLQDGFRVLVHDATFGAETDWRKFAEAHPQAERLDAAEPAAAAQEAWSKAGRIDAVVSNDHLPASTPATETATEAYLRQSLEVLVARPFLLAQAAIPHLKAQGGGNIVMITSCRTRLPMSGGAIPDMCRAAENALVRSLAVELAPHSIAVNAIAPNFLYSEAYYPRAVFIDDPAGRSFVEQSVPAGRLGEPQEIGAVIGFLAATEARFLTGAIIDFAGGWPFSPVRPK